MDEQENYKILEALREITTLGPIAKLKLERARKSAERYTDLYRKLNPSDEIGVDYSEANDFEFQLRKEALERKLEREWSKYLEVENDGIGLEEYAMGYLEEYLNNKKGFTRH